jgi:uncharacterized protein DUF2062/methyltransferase family protein
MRAALSVAIGLAVGVTPLWGVHIFLVLAICLPLGLDAPVSYLAANISMPLIAPFLVLAEVDIGSWLLTGHAPWQDAETVWAMGASRFARELALGTLVFAPAAALVGGVVTYAAVSLVWAARAFPAPGGYTPDPQGAFRALADRVAKRFSMGRPSAFYYARGKMLSDPVAKRVWELSTEEPLGEVVDIGSGRGQIGVLLLESGGAAKVSGFDWDGAKVLDATRAAEGLAASFEEGDIRTHEVPPCDTALLVDVLHYLTDEEQDALLLRAARAATRRVVVRDIDPDRGWRSTMTRAQEALTTSERWNRGQRVHIRPIACIVRALEGEGFDVTVEPCWGATPFANVLVVGRRRTPSP